MIKMTKSMQSMSGALREATSTDLMMTKGCGAGELWKSSQSR
jgi:hypothetical protein